MYTAFPKVVQNSGFSVLPATDQSLKSRRSAVPKSLWVPAQVQAVKVDEALLPTLASVLRLSGRQPVCGAWSQWGAVFYGIFKG